MAQTNINMRMDDNSKQPFEVALETPNAETLAAINDVNRGRNLSNSFYSVKELMADLNA